MYCIIMKEFCILIRYRYFFNFFLTFCNTLHCILKFMKMSVEIMDNILVIYQHVFHFIAFFLSFLILGHFKIVNLTFSG